MISFAIIKIHFVHMHIIHMHMHTSLMLLPWFSLNAFTSKVFVMTNSKQNNPFELNWVFKADLGDEETYTFINRLIYR